jgi:hypothetical protein
MAIQNRYNNSVALVRERWLEFQATDPDIRVRFLALPYFLREKTRKTVVGLERGSTQPREYN